MKNLIRFISTKERVKMLSDFWMNVSVAWFVAASLASVDLLTRFIYIAIMILALSFALYLRK